MTLQYLLPDSRVLSAGTPFTLGEVRYPSRWLSRATPEDLAALGIVAQEAPAPEPGPNPMTTPATAHVLLDYLADLRYDAEIAGTTWGEIPLPTDRERRSALKDAADKMRDGTLSSPISVAFSTEVYASVTQEQLDAAVATIAVYVQRVFTAAHTVAAQISDGTLTTRQAVSDAFDAAMSTPA